MKILFLDIETSPHIVDAWSLFDVKVGLPQLREPSQMICAAAKFAGEKVKFWSLYHDNRDDMLAGIWEMMDQADVIVHYNGARFDIPTLNREFITGGFQPPSSAKQVDLYKVVRRRFKFASNKLDYVSRALGLSGKVSHPGHALWTGCLEGDAQSWKIMAKYNKQDVELLEHLLQILRPWITEMPNAQLYSGQADTCPDCGGANLKKKGFEYLLSGRYQRYICKDCKRQSRSVRRESGVNLQVIK